MRRRSQSVAALAVVIGAVVPATAQAVVTTVAGGGFGYGGDGGPAVEALFGAPQGAALLPDGTLLIADTQNNRLRRVAGGGATETAAGTGAPVPGERPSPGGDGGPATAAQLTAPRGVAVAADGSVLVADSGSHRVRRIDPGGTITTIAGAPMAVGLSGDGGPATAARLNTPTAIAPTADGAVLIADTGNHRIRRVGPDGVITTVAGTGAGFGGDGGPAHLAQLDSPTGVTALPGGGFLIADTGNGRVRRVLAGGAIATVAGGGVGFAGDGGPAHTANLAAPGAVLALPNGGLLIADTGADRLRRITPLGAVVTVAGGRRGLGGDGGPNLAAMFDTPTGLVSGPGTSFLVADSGNSRVRSVSDLGSLPAPEPLRTVGVQPLAGAVHVRPRGGAAPIHLAEADLAPNVSAVDASRGTIRLRVRPLDATTDLVADVGGDSFTIVQPVADSAVADLRLSRPLACGATARAASSHQARRRAPQRRVRIKVRGRYKTTGRFASAVASGTAWTITDRCDRTIIRVTQGSVVVRDTRLNRNVRVRAGRNYVALARPAARR